MLDLIDETWYLKRDIVSDGYDQALYRLSQEVPMKIHEYPSGEQCWTWRIPEKWTCQPEDSRGKLPLERLKILNFSPLLSEGDMMDCMTCSDASSSTRALWMLISSRENRWS